MWELNNDMVVVSDVIEVLLLFQGVGGIPTCPLGLLLSVPTALHCGGKSTKTYRRRYTPLTLCSSVYVYRAAKQT